MNPHEPRKAAMNVTDNHGVAAAHIETLNINGQPSTSIEDQVTDYYRRIAEECRNVTLHPHHPTGPDQIAVPARLSSLYVEPDVYLSTTHPEESQDTGTSDAKGNEAIQDGAENRTPWRRCFESAELNQQRLLLVADGGMGKTTAIDVQIQRIVAAGTQPWLALRLPQLARIPTTVSADKLVESALTADMANKLGLAPEDVKALIPALLGKLNANAGFLLFDSLDEVPERDHQRVIAGVLRFIADLVLTQPGHKVLITSRPYALHGARSLLTNLQRAGFRRLALAPLTLAQQQALVTQYFALKNNPRVGQQLLAQLQDSRWGPSAQEQERLMREPMLATYACMLAEHQASDSERGELGGPMPTTRHALLDGVVSLLLEKWDVQRRDSQQQTERFKVLFEKDQQDLAQRSALRRVLEAAALQEHLHAANADEANRLGERSVLHEAISIGEASWPLSHEWLIAEIDRAMPEKLDVRAHKVVNWLLARSGLIKRLVGPGLLAIQHRQLADFLAAGALWGKDVKDTDPVGAFALELVVRVKLSPNWSRQLIALGFSRLSAGASIQRRAALAAIREALREWEDWCGKVNTEDSELGTAVLAQALAQTIPADWVSSDKALDAALNPLRQRLVTILAEQRLSAPERADAADSLGTLGDPRFAPGLWLPRERYGYNSAVDEPLPGFVRVPAGPFWIGEEDMKDNPPHEANIESDFYVARSLTTVAQFRRFVDAGAYGAWSTEKDLAIWGACGLAWRKAVKKKGKSGQEQLCQPIGWADQLAYPHRPVIYVSWWEARAYARWLNTDSEWQLAQNAVAAWAKHRVCLPTELQWERVARMNQIGGAHRHRWPWGDEADDFSQRANVGEAGGVGRVSTVGCFEPNPFGVWDLSGKSDHTNSPPQNSILNFPPKLANT